VVLASADGSHASHTGPVLMLAAGKAAAAMASRAATILGEALASGPPPLRLGLITSWCSAAATPRTNEACEAQKGKAARTGNNVP
jgi:hypothetical protein